MLEFVIKDAVLRTNMADAPRVFTTRPEHASALMQKRNFTLLGAYELNEFNSNHFMNDTQKLAILDYMHDVRKKVAEGDPVAMSFLDAMKTASNNLEINNAPRTIEEFQGKSGIILLPTGKTIMIYHVLSPFDACMLNDTFYRDYFGALESINDASCRASYLKGYIESTYDQMSSVMLRRDERAKYIIDLDTVTGLDVSVISRAYALIRIFGVIA